MKFGSFDRQLWSLVNDALNSPMQPPICVLTADQRDNWALARDYLIQLDPRNKEMLRWIETSLFVLCLDDYASPDSYDQGFRAWPHSLSHNLSLLENMAYAMDGHNRWYDKTISIICMSNGRGGMNGEHSPCDALIPSRLMDWLVEK